MSTEDGVIYISRAFLRDTLAPALAADGWGYLHCPDQTACGEFTIVPAGDSWRCPTHDAKGVAP